MEIQWRNGYRSKGVDPAKAYGIFQSLVSKHGCITPEAVVSRARATNSPIHKAFEWNDKVAGAEYRKHQARNMIAAIQVVRLELPDLPTRAFEVRSSSSEESKQARNVYDTTEAILANPKTRAELLGRAIRELQSFRHRYGALKEMSTIIHAVDEVLNSEGTQARVPNEAALA